MYLCYIDESGTSDIPGNTSHFILAGISVPIWHWTDCDRDLARIKWQFDLGDAEIHTAWILRRYLEQSRIANFDQMAYQQRRTEVERIRNTELLRLQRSHSKGQYRQAKKNYQHTGSYIHLTQEERKRFISEVADCVSSWGFARLFAECIDKVHFDPQRTGRSVDEQALEQIVSRFEHYLQAISAGQQKAFGVLIHDNNETVARRHTALMRTFHRHGTLWTQVKHIVETPLFVDSQLTGMVQIADLCAYVLRRYLKNQETDIFDKIFQRADRKDGLTVGVRHFSPSSCRCKICVTHTPVTF
jgi:Protein of unknown function (DUF3800)